MGLRVGGSCRESSSDMEGAGPVGSRVGGSGGLVSSAKEKKNLLEHFRKYGSQLSALFYGQKSAVGQYTNKILSYTLKEHIQRGGNPVTMKHHKIKKIFSSSPEPADRPTA